MPGYPISKEQARAVKKAVSILDVVSRYAVLRKVGQQWVGECPLHPGHGGDRCLTVSIPYQSWKCWKCGAGGDAITAVMKFEDVAFPLAVRFLAEQAKVADAIPPSPY